VGIGVRETARLEVGKLRVHADFIGHRRSAWL
jgi:hypothetical protein